MKKPAITQTPIAELIANRWSGRAYDANKPVTRQQITALLEAARWAPSCYGDQPWRFIVWDKLANKDSWQLALDCIVPSNQSWAKDAQVLLLVCANTLFDHNSKPNRWAQYDTGAAAENLCLQAEHMGLMAHQMGGFDADLAYQKFNIPVEFTLMAMLSVGYPADIKQVTGDALERETTPRKRKPLEALFFEGSWAKPVNTSA